MSAEPGTPHLVTIALDASGSWGCGTFVEEAWLTLPRSEPIKDMHITVKELAPAMIAAVIWGRNWRGKNVLAYYDSAPAVALVNQEMREMCRPCN